MVGRCKPGRNWRQSPRACLELVKPMTDHRTERWVNLHKCWDQGRCGRLFTFTGKWGWLPVAIWCTRAIAQLTFIRLLYHCTVADFGELKLPTQCTLTTNLICFDLYDKIRELTVRKSVLTPDVRLYNTLPPNRERSVRNYVDMKIGGVIYFKSRKSIIK